MLHLHVGDKTMSLQLRDPNAELDLVNSRLKAQGLPNIDQGTWANYSQDARNSLGIDAMNFTDPGRGHVTPDTLVTLQNRLGLVKAQSDFTGKDAIVSSLQTAVDLHTSILNREGARQAQQKAQEITTTGAAQTENQVANIKATAGPEASAAGQKAEAVAKGNAKGAIEGQMSGLGGSTTTGTLNPQTGADEGFLSQLPPQHCVFHSAANYTLRMRLVLSCCGMALYWQTVEGLRSKIKRAEQHIENLSVFWCWHHWTRCVRSVGT
jgi:hypothetical protein